LANVFVKHWRLVVLVLVVALFIWLIYLARYFVLPFAIGLILAYLLLPVVFWLEKRLPPRQKWGGFKRVIAVIIVFILLICIIGGFLYILVSAVIDATTVLVENTPYFINQTVQRVQEWFEGIISTLPADMQQQVRQALADSGTSIGAAIRDALLGTFTAIPAAFDVILGFAVLPFFLFYLLKDHEKLKNGLRSALPANIARHGRNVANIVEQVLGRYVKSQLVLGFVVAYFVFVGLTLLKVPYSIALALLAGVAELIPTLGPWIGGAVAVIVTLAMAPDKAIWVAVIYLAVQLLENNLLVPKIQSVYLRIHPAVMIVLLVFGAYIAGIWGIILIGPLTATLVEIYKYIRDCVTCREQLHLPNL
jgi:predicted PurR-regulated permease PerM